MSKGYLAAIESSGGNCKSSHDVKKSKSVWNPLTDSMLSAGRRSIAQTGTF